MSGWRDHQHASSMTSMPPLPCREARIAFAGSANLSRRMRGSLWTKLLSLSPEQMALLGENRERWTEIRRSTAPADREAAEHGVRLAYLASGHLPPSHIVWCASPIEMANLWGQTPHDQAGANVRTAVVNK